MVLSDATGQRLEFARQRRLRAPVLVGIGFAVLAVLPLIGPGSITLMRLGAAVVFALVSALLIGVSRPRVERFHISLDDRVLSSGARRVPLSRVRRILLLGRPGSDSSAEQRYCADLLLDDGSSEPFLESNDPARVLADLGKVVEVLEIPVEAGWGLDADAKPWQPSLRVGPPNQVSLSAHPFPSQRAAAITVLIGGTLTGVLMAIFIISRYQDGKPTSPLSFGLAAVMVAIILGVGVLLVTDRVSAQTNGKLVVERRILGRLWWRKEIPELSRAHAIGPEPGEPQHVLFETADGLVSVPFVGPAAVELAEALSPPDRDH